MRRRTFTRAEVIAVRGDTDPDSQILEEGKAFELGE